MTPRSLLFTLTCSLFLLSPAFAATRTLTDADNGTTVRIHPADRLTLRLKSNATTGYTWSLLPDSTPLLHLEHKNYEGPAMPIPGAGGTQVFTFRAEKKGNGDLHLHYTRPEERPRPHQQEFVLHLEVH